MVNLGYCCFGLLVPKYFSLLIYTHTRPYAFNLENFVKNYYHPDIAFIIQTLVNEPNAKNIVKRLGFHSYERIPPIKHSIGIWALCYTKTTKVHILVKDDRAIHFYR